MEVSTVTLASGLTLSYVQQGPSSGPALLVLPGPTDSWRSYKSVLEHLRASLRAVAVSQRGHGDSDKPSDGYRVADFAADAVQLLDALDIPHGVLVGHSGSCLVARRVAIDQPERVVGLVLEASPTTLRGHRVLTEYVEEVIADLEDPIDPEFARGVIVDTSSDDVPPEVVDEMAADLLKVPARVWHQIFADLLEYDDLAELGRITAPALLVWGDADTLVPHEMQQQLTERLLSAEIVVYHGVGHTPRWEDPARFAADVVAFAEPLLSRS